MEEFVKKGHEIHLIIPRNLGIPENYSYSGIFIHEFKMPLIRFGKSLISRILETLVNYFYYFLFILLATKRFMNVMKVYGTPDIVYGYSTNGCATAYLISRLCRVPNITRSFGTLLFGYISNIYYLFARAYCLEFFAYKLPCKYLIITDDGTRGDEVARMLNVPSERVKYWMNGVDFLRNVKKDVNSLREELGIPLQAHVIISVCRLTKWKGVDRIIQAVPAIAVADSNVKVIIIGDGEERENLEKLTDALGVKNLVDFLGAMVHEDVEKYMRIADLYVSLYDFSNLSSSLLEAMACGVCIVTLNSGKTSQLITHGINGILIGYDDLRKLPSIINRLLNDDNMRRELGNQARQYALKNFSTWDERVNMEVELIEHLLGATS